jgi:hypothetical protein
MSGYLALMLYVLIPMNLVLYVMLIEGYKRDKRFFEIPKVAGITQALALFEKSYRQSFPQEKEGFTWKEAIKKANGLTNVSPSEAFTIRKVLEKYEAYRYGRIGQETQIDAIPILKLTVLLRKKRYFG